MFGQPPGLKTLFFTEMWERMSYYGMRAILILFLVESLDADNAGMGIDTVTAGAIYGLYTSLVYLTALPGGWLADTLLGLRKTVFLGGCVIAAGHFCMAIPGEVFFFLGLLLIIIGTGMLKPNISAMVGDLYPEGGARRDAGYSIYYMGINLGATLGPLICGYLGQNINWHYGFLAAGIGMVAGLIQYHFGQKSLGDAGLPPEVAPQERKSSWKKLQIVVGGTLGLSILAIVGHTQGWFTLTFIAAANVLKSLVLLAVGAYFLVIFLQSRWTLAEKKRCAVILVLCLSAAIFWAGFEQAGSSLNIFAEDFTNMGNVPASWFQSANPFFIILLAPLFSMLWQRLAVRQPSISLKFGLGLIIMAAGFLVISMVSKGVTEENRAGAQWLLLTYFLHTTGELCLSPVGLSGMTKLAPRPLAGQMMGIWFTSSAFGSLIAGLTASQMDEKPLHSLFGDVFVFATVTGVVLILASPLLRNLAGKETRI